ncbi:MAG: septation ring formation regulator EzrA [Bacilli bacterium]
MGTNVSLWIVTYVVVAIVLIIVVLSLMKKKKEKNYNDKIMKLETEKNLISSTPILSELSKVEEIIKTEKMEEKYKEWQDRFENIKKINVSKITDMIVELDVAENIKEKRILFAKTELEIYKARNSADNILKEINDITLSEEKYRGIVTKLKNKYRELQTEFQEHKVDYEDVSEPIELQLENIETMFLNFEKSMEDNEYSEVVHIVKALDNLIEHLSVVIEEVPNLLLMANHLIPHRVLEIKDINATMIKNGYALDFLNVDYNIEETNKQVKLILERIKVLDLTDCMFELKTILDYLDSLFTKFEEEKQARREYEELEVGFSKKIKKTDKVVKDIYKQIDDIKNMYDLTDEDVTAIDDVNKRLLAINIDYKDLQESINNRKDSYVHYVKEIEILIIKLKELEEDLDVSLKSLGSMYDDEVRAREQLEEIQEFLKQSKSVIRSYKLPIITNNYFVELSEANEAILEIIKELEKKPITIKTLNTRVDTARDLVLKLYNTTNEMIKDAKMSEIAIVYGNRYRSNMPEIDSGLNNAGMLFYKGKYRQALDTAIQTISFIDSNVERRVKEIYDEQ